MMDQATVARNPVIQNLVELMAASQVPYDQIMHYWRVVNYTTTMDEAIVAFAHDLLEDNHVTYPQLCSALGEELADKLMPAVFLLTRTAPYNYNEYIETILKSGNMLAIKVKVYDILDHLHPEQWATGKPTLVERYTHALNRLVLFGEIRTMVEVSYAKE